MNANSSEKFPASLLLRVRKGDEAAFAALLSAYEPLLHAETGRYAAELGPEDMADLAQVARVALYHAVLEFRLDQSEVEFGLFAKKCVSNALTSQWRSIRRRLFEVSVSDAPLLGGTGDDPARRVEEEEAVAALRKRIRAALSPYENRVWNLYTAGFRSGEIARALGKPSHSVENAVYRIRRKLRLALQER